MHVRWLSLPSILFALTSAADSQCAQWSDQFHEVGTSGAVLCSAVFDSGSGAALYVGGVGLRYSNLAVWTGAGWYGILPNISAYVYALCVFDDGTGPALYAAGSFTSTGTVGASNIARWDGTQWMPLGSGVDGQVRALAVYDDGSGAALYAGGVFAHAGGIATANLARWNGSNWSDVGGGVTGPSPVAALQVYDAGSGPELVVTGSFDHAGATPTNNIARWNGSQWHALGAGINDFGYALCTWDHGSGPRLVVGGRFTNAGVSARAIAEWDGASWSALGGGMIDLSSGYTPEVDAVRAFDDGSGLALYAGGAFQSANTNGNYVNSIARWNGQTWSALAGGMEQWNTIASVRALTIFDDGHGTGLYAGGEFQYAGGTWADSIARWRNSSWTALANPGAPNDAVFSFTSRDEPSGPALYVGGAFRGLGGPGGNGVARWDGTAWSGLGSGLSASGSWKPAIHALAFFDDGAGPVLFAGGEYVQSSGSYTSAVLATFDGAQWTSLGVSGTEIDAMATFDDGSGPALYIGGQFAAGTAWNIARRKNGVFSPVGGSSYGNFRVRSLRVFDDGSGAALYAGGSFTTIGGANAALIAKWNGVTWSPLGTGLYGPAEYQASVAALVVHDDGTGPALYAGGDFYGAGTIPCTFIGRWNGSTWSVVGDGTSDPIFSLTSFDDGTGGGPALYVGGSFTSTAQCAANRVAQWDGAHWHPLGGGVDGTAFALTGFTDAAGQRDLYVGGSFWLAGGHQSQYVARWVGCGQTGKLFCFGDGSATACPCGNASAVGDRVGCLNSQNLGASLRASGEPSLAHDTLVLHGAQMPNGSALYFQGTSEQNGGAGTMFGDGLRCAGGSVLRLMTKTPSGGMSQYPDAGDPPVSVRGLVPSPATRTYQIRYRNAASFCTSAAFNLSNGVEIVWSP